MTSSYSTWTEGLTSTCTGYATDFISSLATTCGIAALGYLGYRGYKAVESAGWLSRSAWVSSMPTRSTAQGDITASAASGRSTGNDKSGTTSMGGSGKTGDSKARGTSQDPSSLEHPHDNVDTRPASSIFGTARTSRGSEATDQPAASRGGPNLTPRPFRSTSLLLTDTKTHNLHSLWDAQSRGAGLGIKDKIRINASYASAFHHFKKHLPSEGPTLPDNETTSRHANSLARLFCNHGDEVGSCFLNDKMFQPTREHMEADARDWGDESLTETERDIRCQKREELALGKFRAENEKITQGVNKLVFGTEAGKKTLQEWQAQRTQWEKLRKDTSTAGTR